MKHLSSTFSSSDELFSEGTTASMAMGVPDGDKHIARHETNLEEWLRIAFKSVCCLINHFENNDCHCHVLNAPLDNMSANGSPALT